MGKFTIEKIGSGATYKGIRLHTTREMKAGRIYVITQINSGMRICGVVLNFDIAERVATEIAEAVDWESFDGMNWKNEAPSDLYQKMGRIFLRHFENLRFLECNDEKMKRIRRSLLAATLVST